jgi:hypothetical protein
MKGFLFLILILTYTESCFCQNKSEVKPTKLETEQWIKEKIASNSYDGGDTKHNYSIYFEAGEIVIKDQLWMSITGFMNLSTRFRIADLDYLSMAQKTDNVWLTLHLQSGKIAYQLCEGMPDKIDIEGTYDFILNKSFLNENLPERMKKAFSRLMELNGGKALVLKEAY